jgi:hypothetical protein
MKSTGALSSGPTTTLEAWRETTLLSIPATAQRQNTRNSAARVTTPPHRPLQRRALIVVHNRPLPSHPIHPTPPHPTPLHPTRHHHGSARARNRPIAIHTWTGVAGHRMALVSSHVDALAQVHTVLDASCVPRMHTNDRTANEPCKLSQTRLRTETMHDHHHRLLFLLLRHRPPPTPY